VRDQAAAEIGSLTEREVVIAGAMAYWCQEIRKRNAAGVTAFWTEESPRRVLDFAERLAREPPRGGLLA
jgi:hypothetical protein